MMHPVFYKVITRAGMAITLSYRTWWIRYS